MAAGDAKPVPVRGVALRITFPIYDASGTLVTGATGLDSEVSKDQGSFTDCTNEATEIGSTGIYYLDLSATEMDADTVTVQTKTTSSGAKTAVNVLYPAAGALDRVVRGAVAQAGAAGTITLDASASATNDFYNGMLIVLTAGTGVGQARVVEDYVGSTKVATVAWDWATTPDSTTRFALVAMDLDFVFYRDFATLAEASAAKKSLYAGQLMVVGKADDNGAGQLLVYRSDGTTEHYRRAITTDAAANPVKTLGGAA